MRHATTHYTEWVRHWRRHKSVARTYIHNFEIYDVLDLKIPPKLRPKCMKIKYANWYSSRHNPQVEACEACTNSTSGGYERYNPCPPLNDPTAAKQWGGEAATCNTWNILCAMSHYKKHPQIWTRLRLRPESQSETSTMIDFTTILFCPSQLSY